MDNFELFIFLRSPLCSINLSCRNECQKYFSKLTIHLEGDAREAQQCLSFLVEILSNWWVMGVVL